jgi:hypothetical protein
VESRQFIGEANEFRVALKDSELRLKLHSSIRLDQGQSVRIELPPMRCRALSA